MSNDTRRKRAELLDRLWLRTAERLLDAVDSDDPPSAALCGEARKFLLDQGWTFGSAPNLSSTFSLIGVAINALPTFPADDREDPELIEAQEVKAIASEAKALQTIQAFDTDDDTGK